MTGDPANPCTSDAPESLRPCAKCRRLFEPTAQRRMLCAGCYSSAGNDSGLDPGDGAGLPDKASF